ncbi:Mitochondrial organizing structure protein 2 [Escovopsis weberi]|uniref:MICOS complex subunit n=1 Tax=Escovopsis weberi TaxID=150374 RepID=A0A0M9VTY8_ESCWE|nr:Mitochondrial organizing structure protein 2 [Escovopsis weberi]
MAARVLLPKRSLAPLAAAALCGFALAPATVLAEAPRHRHSPATPSSPSPSPSLIDEPAEDRREREPRAHGPTPTDRLAVQIGRARLALYGAAVAAEDRVNRAMDCAFDMEQSFTRTVASLAPSRESGEKLMPGAIYVLVAGMAGSIVTRNRSAVLRVAVPLALGLGASWTVLPVTMRNVSELTWKYEQRFPAVAESHVRVREGIRRGIHFAKVHRDVGVQYVDDKVTDAREAIEGWVKQGK